MKGGRDPNEIYCERCGRRIPVWVLDNGGKKMSSTVVRLMSYELDTQDLGVKAVKRPIEVCRPCFNGVVAYLESSK